MLDLLNLRNFLSLDPVPKNTKIICLWFQTMKNDWVWRKSFGRFITIFNISVDIIRVLFFQLLSIFNKLGCKFESFFTEELRSLSSSLIRYVHLFILDYTLKYAKRLVTKLQGMGQCTYVVWRYNWPLQIHCNPRLSLGANTLISNGWMTRNHSRSQKIYVSWYSFCILGENFDRTSEDKELLLPRSWSS